MTQHSRIHSGEKPFACHHCAKTFAQRGHLTEHQRVHSGEKPFACSDCGKTFAHRGNLTVHARVHSGENRLGVRNVESRSPGLPTETYMSNSAMLPISLMKSKEFNIIYSETLPEVENIVSIKKKLSLYVE